GNVANGINPRFTHGPHLTRRGTELRPGVEYVHLVCRLEALVAQQGECGFGIMMNLANYGLHVGRKQRDVDWIPWHQVGNELLVAQSAQIIRGIIIALEEMPADRFPKWRAPLLVDVAA